MKRESSNLILTNKKKTGSIKLEKRKNLYNLIIFERKDIDARSRFKTCNDSGTTHITQNQPG